MRSAVLLALACASAAHAQLVPQLDADSFGSALTATGKRPLLLFMSRPGCEICDQLAEKWETMAEGVGSNARMAKMDCNPGDKAKSGVSNERFCFGLQSTVRGDPAAPVPPP